VYCLDYTGVITGIHCGAGFELDTALVWVFWLFLGDLRCD
jgi:hypothetical protein